MMTHPSHSVRRMHYGLIAAVQTAGPALCRAPAARRRPGRSPLLPLGRPRWQAACSRVRVGRFHRGTSTVYRERYRNELPSSVSPANGPVPFGFIRALQSTAGADRAMTGLAWTSGRGAMAALRHFYPRARPKTLPRRRGAPLQRRWRRSLDGIALLCALGQVPPTLAAEIEVGVGDCTSRR